MSTSISRLSVGLATAILLIAAPSASALPDFDNDGFGDGDCAPVDPAVFPGAPDKPDLTFEDTNCDGIDGDAARSVFVAESGNDGAAGTRESPKQSIGAALTIAAGRDVLVSGGTYNAVNAGANVGIYGGYVAGSWARSESSVTSIAGTPEAVLVSGNDVHVVLQLLTLRGSVDGAGSAYGLRVVSGSRVAASKVTAMAGDAAGGQNGTPGTVGATGATGGEGQCPAGGPGGGTGDTAGGAGGAGGGPNESGTAGDPGHSESESGANPGAPGAPGAPGQPGGAGGPGGDGEIGPAGGNGIFTLESAASAWSGAGGTAGQPGSSGAGGGGGGGGGGAETAGRGGGGGGSGGAGGAPGSPGSSGSGSFGAYVQNAWLVASESMLAGGSGGSGGNGAPGGDGGQGGPGGPGATCAGAGAGGTGGLGGRGGPGGAGGAGAGGPSAGVFRTGPDSSYASRNTSEHAGNPGPGGTRPPDGAQAAPGLAGPILRAASAPTGASGDFDGDGTLDLADPCPEVAATVTGGCPVRPGKLPDADGDHIPDSADACPSTPRGHDPNEDGCPDGTEPPPPPPPPPPAENPPPAPPSAQPPPPPRAQPARVGATVSFRSSNRGRSTVFSRLVVRNIPGGATVVVRCRGKSCPVRRFVKRRAVGTLSLRQFVGKRLRPGTALDIRVTKSGLIGLVKDITIRAGRSPSVRTLCLPVGRSRASRC
jgi:hypothetical protein